MIGELIGFTLGNTHSSYFNMVRTNKGLTSKEIFGKFQDSTVTIEGSDITVFYNSFFQNKQFQIQASFVGLQENKISEMKKIWNQDCMLPLIFDEAPHKYYMVKVDKLTSMKQLAFERGGVRYYNGDITLSFISYFPYALSRFESLEDPTIGSLPQDLIGFWEHLGDIPQKKVVIPSEGQEGYSDSEITLSIYNPGDLPALFKLWMNLTRPESINESGLTVLEKRFMFDLEISTRSVSSKGEFLLVGVEQAESDDKKMCVDHFRGTLFGYKVPSLEPSGTMYNGTMKKDFIVLPPKEITHLTFKLSNGVVYDGNNNPITGDEGKLTFKDLNLSYEINYVYRA